MNLGKIEKNNVSGKRRKSLFSNGKLDDDPLKEIELDK